MRYEVQYIFFLFLFFFLYEFQYIKMSHNANSQIYNYKLLERLNPLDKQVLAHIDNAKYLGIKKTKNLDWSHPINSIVT